jgi:acyl CoA:acetate/3-ketoacid CoA transferase alpha subunit
VNLPARAAPPRSRTAALADAVRAHVEPGMHLHFASTPSRSNAAIREVARAFRRTRPGFTLSSTGFHSMAHLLPMLGLADRLIACFFGDHYPAPRPNPLYTQLAAAGIGIEHWSLWSLVASLRAGAEGNDWTVNRSLRGTTLASELAARGQYREVAVPDMAPPGSAPGGSGPAPTIGLCAALRPDVTFVHAPAADDEGNVVLSGPRSEGPWSALAARRGVIVTVERIVSAAELREYAADVALPPHRVLAVCEEPFGAHPQPLYCPRGLAAPYRDDFEHYERWRALTTDPAGLAAFVERVLEAPDGGAAYRAYVGAERLAELCRTQPPAARVTAPRPERTAVDRLIVAGARQLAARAQAIDARVLIAGIGHAFFAARLAQLRLAAAGVTLRVMVETGLYDLACDPGGDGYLLAYDNIARARRLTAVDDILGVLVCGADNRCIAALGAAQIDRNGNLNSTRLGNKLLVGAGGASDIAALADEVVVMTRLAPGRLVDEVDHITSAGRGVRSVVTDRCVLTRPRDDAAGGHPRGWTIASLVAPDMRTYAHAQTDADTGAAVARAVAEIARDCPWQLEPAGDLAFGPAITDDEARLLDSLDPTGQYRQRAG